MESRKIILNYNKLYTKLYKIIFNYIFSTVFCDNIFFQYNMLGFNKIKHYSQYFMPRYKAKDMPLTIKRGRRTNIVACF